MGPLPVTSIITLRICFKFVTLRDKIVAPSSGTGSLSKFAVLSALLVLLKLAWCLKRPRRPRRRSDAADQGSAGDGRRRPAPGPATTKTFDARALRLHSTQQSSQRGSHAACIRACMAALSGGLQPRARACVPGRDGGRCVCVCVCVSVCVSVCV